MASGRKIKKDKIIPSSEEGTDVLDHKRIKLISEEALRERQRIKEKYAQDLENMKGKKVQLISFSMAGVQYAVDIMQVGEVAVVGSIDVVPGLPDYVRGVTSINGEVMALIDLAKKFDLGEMEDKREENDEDESYCLVVEGKSVKVAILLEEMPSTEVVSGDNIKSTKNINYELDLHETYVKGLVENESGSLALIDGFDLVESKSIFTIAEEVKK